MRTVTWSNGSVKMIDQTLLPGRLAYVTYTRPEEVVEAIRMMVVRGAPAIGVAAAMGVALAAVRSTTDNLKELKKELEEILDGIVDRNAESLRAYREAEDADREKQKQECERRPPACVAPRRDRQTDRHYQEQHVQERCVG
jgi:methylthioribose-1-phosphate isomerase